MKIQKKPFWLGVLVLLSIALLWVFRFKTMEKNDTASGVDQPERKISRFRPPIQGTPVDVVQAQQVRFQESERRREQGHLDSEREITMWQSPIFYVGKVVDENDKPISGVTVSYGANSLNALRAEVYNKGTVRSDEHGFFKIDGVRGIGLMLQLSHPDYYSYPDNSTGFDKRSLPKKGYFSDSEEAAEIFRMHHKGNPVPLISWKRGLHQPFDGSRIDFPLLGKTKEEIIGHLEIQGWNNIRSETNEFDWRVSLTLREGGIQEKTNLFQYLAPETGFSETADIKVSGSEGVRKEYFIQLPSGYVRFNLHIIMSKDMFFVGEYYFNSDGSRNLEPEEAKPQRHDLPPGATEVIPKFE